MFLPQVMPNCLVERIHDKQCITTQTGSKLLKELIAAQDELLMNYLEIITIAMYYLLRINSAWRSLRKRL